MDEKTRQDLKVLEEDLWCSESRFDATFMEDILADDFCEFGRSGKIYQRQDLLSGNADAKEIDAMLPPRDFRIRALSQDIVQVMYVSEVRFDAQIETSNRSSIWRRDKDGWKLCFHQGTPAN